MYFCSKCGCKLEERQIFCSQCGNNINVDDKKNEENEENFQEKNLSNDEILELKEEVDNTNLLDENNKVEIIYNEEDYENYNETNKGKKLFVKSRVISYLVLTLVLLLGIFYAVGKSLTKPSKVVLKFEQAVAAKDKEDLSSLLYCEDDKLEINEKNTSYILTYFNENPSFFNSVIKDLNNDAIKLEKIKNISGVQDIKSLNILKLIPVGKRWGIFPNYKISIKPIFIEVKTSIKDVAFSLNNKELGKSDSDNFIKEYGPFMPGKYKLLANYKGKYVTLSEPYDIDTINNNENGKVSIEVLENLNYAMIYCEYPEAKLFVNGKDTGLKVEDIEKFGPLSNSTKVYATVNKNGITLKSNEFVVGYGDDGIYLDFSESENLIKNTESELNDLMRWYTYYFTQAVNMDDFSMVESYIYPDSQLYKEQKEYVPNTYKNGIKETILSLKIVSYKLNPDNKSGSIITEEVYEVDNNGESSVKNFKYKYTFAYNELTGSYQLESIAEA